MSKEALLEQLNKGFECLTSKERLILTLYYYEELTPAEIGCALSEPLSEIEIYLAQAKTKMRIFTKIFDMIESETQQSAITA